MCQLSSAKLLMFLLMQRSFSTQLLSFHILDNMLRVDKRWYSGRLSWSLQAYITFKTDSSIQKKITIKINELNQNWQFKYLRQILKHGEVIFHPLLSPILIKQGKLIAVFLDLEIHPGDQVAFGVPRQQTPEVVDQIPALRHVHRRQIRP